MTVVGDQLLLTAQSSVWQANIANGLNEATIFEQVDTSQLPKNRFHSIVASKSKQEAYLVAAGGTMDGDVYRIDQGKLQKQPIHIEGYFHPIKRWLLQVGMLSLLVLAVGGLALVGMSASTNRSFEYSFGHESVLLAPTVRRSLARGIDLSLIFGPLAVRALWCIWITTGQNLIEYLDGAGATNVIGVFLPTGIWLLASWLACIVSTAV